MNTVTNPPPEQPAEPTIADLPKDWSWRARKAGKTMMDIATETGLSYPTINNAVNNKSDPNISTVSKVEEKLKEWGV